MGFWAGVKELYMILYSYMYVRQNQFWIVIMGPALVETEDIMSFVLINKRKERRMMKEKDDKEPDNQKT